MKTARITAFAKCLTGGCFWKWEPAGELYREGVDGVNRARSAAESHGKKHGHKVQVRRETILEPEPT